MNLIAAASLLSETFSCMNANANLKVAASFVADPGRRLQSVEKRL